MLACGWTWLGCKDNTLRHPQGLIMAEHVGTSKWVVGRPSVGLGVNVRQNAWSIVGWRCNMLHRLR